jgi:glycine cleavage system H protein
MTTLKYAPSHEWARLEADSTVTVGISNHAQEALGDIVFLELPDVGREVAAAESVAVVESVKAASDSYAPISGKIIAHNDAIAPSNVAELDGLLSEADYEAQNG